MLPKSSKELWDEARENPPEELDLDRTGGEVTGKLSSLNDKDKVEGGSSCRVSLALGVVSPFNEDEEQIGVESVGVTLAVTSENMAATARVEARVWEGLGRWSFSGGAGGGDGRCGVREKGGAGGWWHDCGCFVGEKEGRKKGVRANGTVGLAGTGNVPGRCNVPGAMMEARQRHSL